MASLSLEGDAQLLFTAPASIRLAPDPGVAPLAERLGGAPDIRPGETDWTELFRGSLTFHRAQPSDITPFTVVGDLAEAVAASAGAHAAIDGITAELSGLAFADGSLSASACLSIPDGWGAARDRLFDAFGPTRRDDFATELRRLLLDWAVDRGVMPEQEGRSLRYLPYFNLTYMGQATDAHPGRAVIDSPDLRSLVYPRAPGPLTSGSPLDEEFLYAGYAFLLLGTRPGSGTPAKLRDLLLVLNVLYGQLAEAASSAKDLLVTGEDPSGITDWDELERDLRMRYREVMTPTFSYDHHVLSLRNAVLDAWGASDLLDRSQELLSWGHEVQTRAELATQARRSRRLNVILTALALLAVFDTADSLWSLTDRLF